MNINLKMNDDINKQRQDLGATWRDLIMIGLNTLKGNPGLIHEVPAEPVKIDPAIEVHLKDALTGLTEAWKLVRTASDKTQNQSG